MQLEWWVHDFLSNGLYIELVAWIFWVLLSITLHELAHGWAAIRLGDRTPIDEERMTANPVVHMGPHALLCFALCGITWGQMPVDPRRLRGGRRAEAIVAAAGPAMNVALFAACAVGCAAWLKLVPGDMAYHREGAVVLFYGAMLNLVLAILNMLPIPPLDGATVLAGFSWKARELFGRPQAPLVGLFVLVAVFFATPIGGILIWEPSMTAAAAVTDVLGGPLGNPRVMPVVMDLEGILENLDPDLPPGLREPADPPGR